MKLPEAAWKDCRLTFKKWKRQQKTIKEADILNATKAMHGEITRIDDKVDKCKGTLQLCTDFADKSKSSIDSFLGNGLWKRL
jgi:hypothetical protein